MILQLKEATNRTLGVLDNAGTVIACSDLSMIGNKRETAVTELTIKMKLWYIEGYTYKILSTFGNHFDYAIFVHGEDDTAECLAIMAAVALNSANSRMMRSMIRQPSLRILSLTIFFQVISIYVLVNCTFRPMFHMLCS